MRTLLLLQALIAPVALAQPVRLKSDHQLAVTGTLMMRPAGRLQFVTVRTSTSYVPIFAGYGSEKAHAGKPVHEIALAGYNYAVLYGHRGQNVTVTGVLTTDDTSPYYLDGMRLEAAHIKGTDGKELLVHSPQSHVAADVGRYDAVALLSADLAAPWRYAVEGKPDTRGMLSCDSNGGGDVVNCFCAEGFHPTNPTSSIAGKAGRGEIYPDLPNMAQFAVLDDKAEAILKVTCSR